MRIDTLIINADTLTMAGKGVGYEDNCAVAIDAGKIIAVVRWRMRAHMKQKK